MPTRTGPANPLALFAVILAVAFVGIPAWQLIGPGPFDWHIRQPAFLQGGLEGLVLVALVAGAFASRPSRSATLLAAVALALFLRRHAVDVPLLIDLLYLEIVVGVGMFVRRCCGRRGADDAAAYLRAFVLGFVAWSIVAWSASALGVGSIHQLRVLTLALGIVALLGRTRPLLAFLWRSLPAQDRSARAWSGALVAWLAIQYSRTKVVYGYDSLWYGLRGEYVLDPNGSVFEPLGLVSPVHYFPKLYEVFLLPVSALGDGSVIGGMSIWILVLVLLACAHLGARIGLDPAARMPVLALVATLPALAATALMPKPDTIAVLFVLVAADAAMAFARTRAVRDACWIVAGATLACMAKLTAIPFAGTLVLGSAWQYWRHRQSGDVATSRDPAPEAIVAAIGALGVGAFVTARTWLLAGMPTVGPDPLFRLWSALGLHLRPPVGTLEWTAPQDWAGVPGLFVDWLFRPQTMPHIVVTWVGNAWFWFMLLAAAAALAGRRATRKGEPTWPLHAMVATGLVLALAIRYQVRGSDGNYFLAALLPGLLLAAHAAFARCGDAVRAGAIACVGAFVLFQAVYGFASAGWASGTRPFDFVMDRTWRDARQLRWETLERAGLATIGRHLRALPADTRAIGYAIEPQSMWLPTRFENLLTILYSHPEWIDNESGFEAFIRDQRIAALVLPKPHAKPMEQAPLPPAVARVAARLKRDAGIVRVDDRDYYLLDLRGRRAD